MVCVFMVTLVRVSPKKMGKMGGAVHVLYKKSHTRHTQNSQKRKHEIPSKFCKKNQTHTKKAFRGGVHSPNSSRKAVRKNDRVCVFGSPLTTHTFSNENRKTIRNDPFNPNSTHTHTHTRLCLTQAPKKFLFFSSKNGLRKKKHVVRRFIWFSRGRERNV